MNTFRFADPLWLLVGAVVLVVVGWARLRGSGAGRVRFSSLGVLRSVDRRPGLLARQGLTALRLLALAAFLIALARPQGGTRIREVTSEGVDIVLTLDASRSMLEEDFQYRSKWVDRLTVARAVVRDFVSKRENDRLGLVVFGEEAFTQCPLTVDYEILVDLLDVAEAGMAGDGTNIGSAIGVSVQRLKDLPGTSKVIILLTDGAQTVGDLTPQQAAGIAEAFGVRIYTVGVGSEDGAPRQNRGIFGSIFDFSQRSSPLDETTLREVAEITGGRYFRATSTAKLEEIYAIIDELEKSEIEVTEHTNYVEFYPYPILLGLLLSLLELLLANTRLRKIP